jgi:hypothetical protein
LSCGRHDAQTQKSPVAEDKGATEGTIESDFNVPQLMATEACTLSKSLGVLTPPIERVTLDADMSYLCVDPGVANGGAYRN